MKSARLWIALLLAIGLLVAMRLLPVQEPLQAFLGWVEETGAWGPVLLALAYIPATVFMVPGTLLSLGAGFAYGVALGTATVSVGSTLGTTAAFLLGRTLMRGWVTDQLQAHPRLKAVDEAVAKQGFKLVFLIRLSPAFPYNLMGYVFGVTRVKFWDHLLASWAGMLPGTILYVYLGSGGRHLAEAAAGRAPERGPGDWLLWGGGLLVTLLVTIYVTRVARRAVREAVPENSPPEADAVPVPSE
jgi:uncharacterized membrane protein YdjX (TVP38/TMEM64 family)